MEEQPPTVTRRDGSKQGGEVRERWPWAEPSIWTDRMLRALETGVKGGVWFSLWDKVCSHSNLEAAFRQVRTNAGGPGVDRITPAMFERDLEKQLERLEQQLRSGQYAAQPIRRVWIPKGDGKRRALGIPTVRDRVVQTAVRNVLEPIFEREFAEHSYGFRPGRGARDALRRVDQLFKAGYRYVVDADIQGYFDNIPKPALLARVREQVIDGRVLGLLGQYLNQPVLEGLEHWTPQTGTPQGAVISPLLANIYLNPLDHVMAARGMQMVRYADDFVVLCQSQQQAEVALELIEGWMSEAGLQLHPEKTGMVDMSVDGNYFEFLGYRFVRRKGRDYRFARPKSMKKLRDALRPVTRRNNAHSLTRIIEQINPVLIGWFGYFKHSHPSVFQEIDGWVRMRLRSILRQRHGGRGRGRGNDHHRWPNAFFVEQGLVSLKTARALASQSLSG